MIGVLMIATVAAQADWGYPEDNNAVVLTPTSHERFIAEFDEAIVYYALPNCDHCLNFDESFSRLAFEYKERDYRVPFARVDCKKYLEFCRSLGIPTYPFIKLFVRRHAFDYYGARAKRALRSFIDATLARTPATLNARQLKEELESNELSLVFVGQRDQQEYNIFDLACRKEDKIKFIHLELDEARESKLFEGSELSSGGFFVFKGTFHMPCEVSGELKQIEKCLYEAQHPSLTELSSEVFDILRQGPQRWMFYFGRDEGEAGLSDFEQFANDNPKHLRFVVAFAHSTPPDLFKQFAEALLVGSDKDLPQVRFVETTFALEGIVRYELPGPLSQASLKALYQGASQRTLPPLLRSEDFDQKQVGNITVISGRSFAELVPSPAREAVVLYHAELTSHAPSREILEALEQLSAEQSNADIAFFLFNADLNELHSFSSQQRPLLLLFSRRDHARPRIYSGPATAEAMQAFISSRRNIFKEAVDLGLSSEL